MKNFILKKISVLFILSLLVIIFCLYFFLFKYGKIEDFGVAGIGALIFLGLGLFGIFLDFVLSRFIKNRITLNIIELIIILLILFWMWFRYGMFR